MCGGMGFVGNCGNTSLGSALAFVCKLERRDNERGGQVLVRQLKLLPKIYIYVKTTT